MTLSLSRMMADTYSLLTLIMHKNFERNLAFELKLFTQHKTGNTMKNYDEIDESYLEKRIERLNEQDAEYRQEARKEADYEEKMRAKEELGGWSEQELDEYNRQQDIHAQWSEETR